MWLLTTFGVAVGLYIGLGLMRPGTEANDGQVLRGLTHREWRKSGSAWPLKAGADLQGVKFAGFDSGVLAAKGIQVVDPHKNGDATPGNCYSAN